MIPFFTRAEPQPGREPSSASDVLDTLGLTITLPERLRQDATRRAFEPAEISQSGDLMAHLALLLRREPMGGAEPQIRDNQRQAQEQVLPVLNRMLVGSGNSTHSLLDALAQEARVRKEQFESAFTQADSRFRTTQQRLHRWQEQAGQRSGSLGADMWRWLVGGQDRLSLPEVVALWNEREHLAVHRAAHRAALDICLFTLDTITSLLSNLDAVIAEMRQTVAVLHQEIDALRQPSTVYAPWTLRVDPLVVANTLAAQADSETLLTDLLRRLTEHDGTALADLVKAIAGAEARRLAQRHTLADMIILDLSAGGEVDGDPLILVGQGLLDALHHPTWQMARGARLRSETIQITPDGTPLYSLEGLTTAAYGGDQDRVGFVEIQLGGAIDDLLLLRDSDPSFQAMLRQRNLYVLDDLALTAETLNEPAPNAAVFVEAAPTYASQTVAGNGHQG
jgi:hypothetical protein